MSLSLDDGSRLDYVDMRMFGRFRLIPGARFEDVPDLAALGPDPLVDGVDVWRLFDRLERMRPPIKVALLDQTVLAGIGNIQASESLYRAKIDPRRPARSLSPEEVKQLAAGIRASIAFTLKSFGKAGADGEDADIAYVEEDAPNPFLVYGRAGARCPRFKHANIVRIVQAQRSTYFCPKCQNMTRPALVMFGAVAFTLASCGGGSAGGAGGKGPSGHVILIDIDDHGLAGLWAANAPNLKGLIARGTLAFSRVVVPTHSNQNNIALLTGQYPDGNDVPANDWLSRANGFQSPVSVGGALTIGDYALYAKNPLLTRGDSVYRATRRAGGRTAYVGELPLFEAGADEAHLTIVGTQFATPLGLLTVDKPTADEHPDGDARLPAEASRTATRTTGHRRAARRRPSSRCETRPISCARRRRRIRCRRSCSCGTSWRWTTIRPARTAPTGRSWRRSSKTTTRGWDSCWRRWTTRG